MLRYEKQTPLSAGRDRSVTGQTRLYIGIVAFALCLLLIFVAIFAPLIVLRNQDTAYVENMDRLERALANAAVTPFRQAIVNASTLSKAMQGYIMSRMTTLPDLRTNATTRMASQEGNFDDFDTIVPTIAKGVAYIATVALQPGGVYWKMHPLEATMVGRDVLLPTDNAHNYVPTPLDSLDTGEVAYIGPAKSSIKFMNGMWTVTVRRPIYNRTTAFGPVQRETFWGFSIAVVNITGVLASRPFEFHHAAHTQQAQVNYLLTTKATRTATRVVVASSLADTSPANVEEFMAKGTSVAVIPNHDFIVTIRGRDYGSRLSANNITVVVATVLAGMFLLFAIFAALMIFCCRAYDASAHAPKLAPFAMLTVGPCRGEELWELAPDEMVDVTDRLGRVLARQMKRHHAYQIQQVHPLTTSYVTRSVAAAVQMAFDAIEELHRRPIDEPLRRLLGDDGRLLLSYAVHWCNDAVVRLDPMEGGYRYEGPDVVYGGRMWAFAAPSVVTASEAVAQALPRFGLRCVTAEHHRRVNVVRSRSVCGATGDGEMNGAGHSTNNASSSSSGGAATIYVPFPAPTTVEAAAGMGRGCCGGGGGGAAPYRPAVAARDDKDVPLPPQTLLTLVDTRRPVLLAARAAAPTPHPQQQQHHRRSDDFPAPANTPAAFSMTNPSSTAFRVPPFSAEIPPESTTTRSSGSSHSEEMELVGAESIAAPGALVPFFASMPETRASTSLHTSGNLLRSSFVIQGDGVTRALLRPVIPHALDVALHVAFDYQAITLGMSYDAVRVLVYYFYSSYKILFRPLAAPERHNIYRRLVTAFGVPQQGILEHLAARCAIRCLQQSTKLRQLAMEQRRRVTTDETPLSIT